jgi:hypothetical protein
VPSKLPLLAIRRHRRYRRNDATDATTVLKIIPIGKQGGVPVKQIACVFTCIFAILILGIQTGKAADKESIKKNLMQNIQNLWKGWQAQDPEPFKQWLSPDILTITSQGVSDMNQVLRDISSNQCQVKSYSLDESGARLTKIDDNTYVITYKATQDVTCGEAKLPSPVMVSEVWSKKDGKWKGYFYQETALLSN